MILALAGPAGCGKSTAAAYLAERYGFRRVRFAGPLKAMLRALLAETGVDAETVERMIKGDLKEAPSALLGGKSPRFAMQRLGTEFGRDLISLRSGATRGRRARSPLCVPEPPASWRRTVGSRTRQ